MPGLAAPHWQSLHETSSAIPGSRPRLDKDQWPQTSDERWLDELYRHYGSPHYWK